MNDPTADVLRRVYPRVLARTLNFTRSLPEAEDAVQEAVVRALSTWPERGAPDAPEAWLQMVAANIHRDRLRRGRREVVQHDALERLAELSPWVRIAVGEPEVERGWKDELLRLVCACCHIAAVHCHASGPDETDWVEIARLYAELEDLRPTPAVRVNRAFALSRVEGPAVGLALLDQKDRFDADEYPYAHLVRGTLLAELGRTEEARASLLVAHSAARNREEKAQIEQRLDALADSHESEG